MRLTDWVEVRGDDWMEVRGDRGSPGVECLYKDPLIVSFREGSSVRCDGDTLVIDADVTGIDKVYFRLEDGRVEVSHRCKDFVDAPIDRDLVEFQNLKGYAPFPFTLLEGVWKAPPGLRTSIRIDGASLAIDYAEGRQLRCASTGSMFESARFAETFRALLATNAENVPALLSSFSGGFDSLLLTMVYATKVRGIVHFAEDNAVPVAHYRQTLGDLPWLVIDSLEDFDEADRRRYFESTDEPCCDPSGFAEYLMARRVARDEAWRGVPIMNGAGADALFGNGRKYHQAHVASKLPIRNLKLPGYRSKQNRVPYGLHLYTMDPRARFAAQYYGDFPLAPRIAAECERVYQVYDRSIHNDAANKLAALTMILRYSVYDIEKIKTAARAFGHPYFLPLESTNVMEYAFSIPAHAKVGFRLGKKVLLRAFPEVRAMPFLSRGFVPQSLKARLIGGQLTEDKYRRYYQEQWIAYSKPPG